MGKKVVVLYIDDFSGQEIPEDQANEVVLRIGHDQYTMTLTEDSETKLREAVSKFTENAEYKSHAPRWIQDKTADLDATSAAQNMVVNNLPPDNATVRGWWSNLRAAQLKALSISAPTGNRGRVPNAVKEAYSQCHQTEAVNVP